MNFSKYCNGFRHLFSRVENHKIVKGILIYNDTLENIEFSKVNDNTIAVYSNVIYSMSFEDFKTKYSPTLIPSNNYKGVELYQQNSKTSINIFIRFFSNNPLILLDSDFDDVYTNFIKNNNKQFTTILNKYYFGDTNHAILKYAFCCCGNSINFLGWFVKNILSSGVNYAVLTTIIEWNNKYSYLSKNLKKGTITAYNGKKILLNLSMN